MYDTNIIFFVSIMQMFFYVIIRGWCPRKKTPEIGFLTKLSNPARCAMDNPAAAKPITTELPRTDDRALRFDRVELAGAFGDLGTLLPIVVGMI